MSNIIPFPRPTAHGPRRGDKCPHCRGKGLITARTGRVLTTIACNACKPKSPCPGDL